MIGGIAVRPIHSRLICSVKFAPCRRVHKGAWPPFLGPVGPHQYLSGLKPVPISIRCGWGIVHAGTHGVYTPRNERAKPLFLLVKHCVNRVPCFCETSPFQAGSRNCERCRQPPAMKYVSSFSCTRVGYAGMLTIKAVKGERSLIGVAARASGAFITADFRDI